MNKPFVRDHYTWLAYFMLAYYAYIQAVLGPAVPFLRKEIHINYTVSALYISAFAAGMVIAGFTGARMVRRFGRPLLFWGGGLAMAVGAAVLTLSRTAEVGIASVLILSVVGSYVLVIVQSTLSDQHGDNRAFALTEANVFAVLAASAAPLAVGFSESQGWTWRTALYIGIVLWTLVFVWFRRHIPLPESSLSGSSTGTSTTKHGKLPRAFWSYWLIVFFSVSVEWCMIFWASTYMETVVGLSKETAASSVALFTIAQFVGRFAGSRLTRRYPSSVLLLIAGAIVLIGFPIFWLGRVPWVNASGLFICGLGVANLYPLTLTLTSAVGMNNPDAASGLTSMGSGMAILLTPQLLGVIADKIGIQSAYGIVAPLAIAIIIGTLYANRLARQREQLRLLPNERSG